MNTRDTSNPNYIHSGRACAVAAIIIII